MGTLAVIYILQPPSLKVSIPPAEIPVETIPLATESPVCSDKYLLWNLNYALLWGLQTQVRSSFSCWPNADLVHKKNNTWALFDLGLVMPKLGPVSEKLLWEELGGNCLKLL